MSCGYEYVEYYMRKPKNNPPDQLVCVGAMKKSLFLQQRFSISTC